MDNYAEFERELAKLFNSKKNTNSARSLEKSMVDTVEAYIQAEKLSSEIRRIGNDLLREAVLTDPRPSQRYINSLLKDLTYYTEKSFQVVVFICRVYLDAIEKAEEDTKNDN